MSKTAPRKRPKPASRRSASTTAPQPIQPIQPPPPPPADTELPQRRRWDPRRITDPAPLFPLGVLFGLNMVDELDRVAISVLSPEIRDWFGVSITVLSFIVVAIVPVSLLLELPIAYYGDRRNRARLAIVGGAIWGGFSVLTGLAWNIGVLIIARLGATFGRLFNATHNSLLSDYYPAESRVRVFYAHRFANQLGQFIAPLAAGFLAAIFVWRTPFVLFAIPTAIFVLLGMRLKEPKRGVHERIAAGVFSFYGNDIERKRFQG